MVRVLRERVLGNRGGFTLIEIVAVLTLIALATAVTMPVMWKTLGKAELRGAARGLGAQLRLARSRAAVRSERQVMSFDVERGEWRLFARGSEEEEVEEGGEFFRLPRGVHFKSVEVLDVPDLTEQEPGEGSEYEEEMTEEVELEFLPQGVSSGVRIVIVDMRGRAFTVKAEPGAGIVSVLEGEEDEEA